MASKIYKNLWTVDELTYLQKFFDQQSYTYIQEVDGILWCKNKNLHYHIPGSPVYKIIRPKLQEIFGNHEMANGCYKESYFPYATHVDGYNRPDFKENIISDQLNHDVAVLIPFSENEHFNTITFNCYDSFYADMGGQLPTKWLTSSNDLDLNLFTHINPNVRKDIAKLPVDVLYNWQLGSCLTWGRDQLHSSTDFAKYGLMKKYIILFIA